MRWALPLVLALGTPLLASPADEARSAMAALEAAAQSLDEAGDGRDRVAALTETIHAFEDGLAAIRVGLRAATQEEARLTRALEASQAQIARLIGALQVLGQRPTAQLLLHPEGPTGAARSGMLLADVTPAIQEEVAALTAELEEVRALRILQEDAEERLRAGLIGVQEARAELAQAIADRAPLPKRFTADPVRVAVLIGASETLAAFAEGLSTIAENEVPADLPSAASLKGAFAMPVRGVALRGFNEADAAGVARPGLIYATRPSALVTAPATATVRFEGALLDYGNVMILEPAGDVLVVLAGLGEVYVTIGDVVSQGAPVGLMGGPAPEAGPERSETLYIEVRHEEKSVDPTDWFAMERN
ncbi:MAG: peptidoglycan DD-metalloendopeptidase family protein [Pseudomonadota bacterium]